jgi:hypothetical protein
MDVLGVEFRDYSIVSFKETRSKDTNITNDLYVAGFKTPAVAVEITKYGAEFQYF